MRNDAVVVRNAAVFEESSAASANSSKHATQNIAPEAKSRLNFSGEAQPRINQGVRGLHEKKDRVSIPGGGSLEPLSGFRACFLSPLGGVRVS